MQGFFNFLIFIRPRVMKIKKANPHACYLTILHQSVLSKRSSEIQREKRDSQMKGEKHTTITQKKKTATKRDSWNIMEFDTNDLKRSRSSTLEKNNDDSFAEMNVLYTSNNALASIVLEIVSDSDEESCDEKKNIDIDLQVEGQSNDLFLDETTLVRENSEM